MLYHLLLTLLFISSQVTAKKSSTPSWEDCGGSDALLKIHSIDLDNPVQIGKNNPIRITMNATQAGVIKGDSIVSLKINKQMNVLGAKFPIFVPCINGIGSCQMTLCELFKIHRKLVCAIFEAANQSCDCPSPPGEYNVNNVKYQLNFGLIPQALLAIGNGDYTLDMKINQDDKEVGCMKLSVAVKFVNKKDKQ